jgi:type IX secretion system substrate protein
MKTKKLLLFVAVGITAGLFFANPFSKENDRKYTPRDEIYQANGIKGAYEYIMRRKANQNTHRVDIADVVKAQSAIVDKRMKKSTNALGLEWIEMGPDNIGGRTRALLFDNENPNLVFAGGVAGGIFKSTTGGNSWAPVDFAVDDLSEFANYAVSCITQTPNGDIYVGTGEGWLGQHGANHHTPMIMGGGIYKSTDRGENWNRLSSTWSATDETLQGKFAFVNEIAADPTTGDIYAATAGGLLISTDDGSTWNPVSYEDVGYENRLAQDVAIASDGSIVASVGNNCFIKRAGQDSNFKLRSGSVSDGLISSAGVGRLEFAFSAQYPDFVYCIGARNDGSLSNIYQSTDKGNSWIVIGFGGSADFQPLGTQGVYDIAIFVDNFNPNIILVAGLNVWQGQGVTGSTLFAWEQITQWSLPENNPIHLHADQHGILQSPIDSSQFFIISDGGIDRAEQGVGFVPIDFGYNTLQPFAVDCGGELKAVIGGTQDNGTVYIDGSGNTEMTGDEVMGGDGAYGLISELNPNIIFMTSYFGRLQRSNNRGGDNQFFYSTTLMNYHSFDVNASWTAFRDQGSFVTPIALWETKNDPLSTDTILFVCRRDYDTSEVVKFESQNIFNMPIWKTIQRPASNSDYPAGIAYMADDTIKIHDPYQSVFALGLARQLWITRNGTNFSEVIETWSWYPILPKDFIESNVGTGDHEDIENVQFSADGDHIFFSTNRNKIYRSSNIQLARDRWTASAFESIQMTAQNQQQVIESRLVRNFPRSITGIAIDPDDANNMVVTLGNYGNDDYVYYTTNAAEQVSTTAISFVDKTGDLPKMPVYDAVFNKGTKNVILGTEYGVFATADITESAPTWTEENGNLQSVPVFMIRQQTAPYWWPEIENHGCFYIATHARGFYRSETFLKEGVGIEEPVMNNIDEGKLIQDIYPNPIVDDAKLLIENPEVANAEVTIIDLQGRVVGNIQFSNLNKGINELDIDMSELPTGTYIINVKAGNNSDATKVIKY